jgi:hypothetical protein
MTMRIRALAGGALVVALAVGLLPGTVKAAQREEAVESAESWASAYNYWLARHDRPDRIVAFVDQDSGPGVRYVEVEIAIRDRSGIRDVCGWFELTEFAVSNPSHQIVGGGTESCRDVRADG